MWKFIKEYSYDAVKMFITQCAIAVFGLVLSLASGLAKNAYLMVITSIGSVLFYLFLLYTSVWEMGAKDKISVDYGHKAAMPLKGLYIALIANSLNIILAVLIALGKLISPLHDLGAVAQFVNVFIQSMYSGLLSIHLWTGSPLHEYFFVFFLTPIPALWVCWLGYRLGSKNIRLAGPLSAPLSPKNKKDK